MTLFRKKPVVVEARRFETNNDDGSHLDELVAWIGGQGRHDNTLVYIDTLEGTMTALVGDWIKGYDALFKVPVTDAPSFDGTRAVSRAFQLEIDATLERLISAFSVDVVRLDPADRDGWMPQVVGALRLPERAPQVELFGEG